MKGNYSSNIYLAGHTGLVGSALHRKLKEKGYSNLTIYDIDELDLRRQNLVEGLFEKNCPEYVFHAAAKVGGIVANDTYKAEFIYDNIMISSNIIHSAYKYGVKKMINLGSSCIYPKYSPQPMKEEYLLTDTLEPTNEPYAIAKIAAIKLCRYYNEQYGTNFISVMPTNLYGRNDNYNLETSHVFPALIRKMILGKLLSENNFELIKKDITKYKLGFGIDKSINTDDENSIIINLEKIGISKNNIKVWGTGNVFREFLHVDDMAEACVFLMENYSYKDIGEFINIGTGEDMTIRDLVYIIKDIVGYNEDIIFDKDKPEGTHKKQLDVSRLFKLGWKPKITLSTGIKMVVSEYLQNLGIKN
ncbi:MAG: GDP-L-fucose synthase [Ignavibacteriae bacterium]|nr:GDP-L-fucose synthase [Ignavibacteriota bacterium]